MQVNKEEKDSIKGRCEMEEVNYPVRPQPHLPWALAMEEESYMSRAVDSQQMTLLDST